MPWKSYDEFIRKQHVHLVGWPLKEVGPIDNLNEATLEQIRDAVEAGDCRWETIEDYTDTEPEEQPPSRKRKERSDKGKKCGSKKRPDNILP